MTHTIKGNITTFDRRSTREPSERDPLLLGTLPLEDDLEEPHEGVDGGGDLVDLAELADGVLVEGLLLVHPLDELLCLDESLLDGADVLYVLLHHVQLSVVVELIHALLQLL